MTATTPPSTGGPASDTPSRLLLDQVADRWSVQVLDALCQGPLRFNALRRRLDGVTQKSLSQCLRRLERNGIVERRVIASAPVAVEYRITPLGRTLDGPLGALYRWTVEHLEQVQRAQRDFDARAPADLG